MGLFDGLFGGEKKAKFDRITPFDNVPSFLRADADAIGTNAFKLFRGLSRKGETRAAEELFSRARTATEQDFRREVEQAGLNLNRLGLGSSGQRDKVLAALALSFGDTLARQDRQREEALLDRQITGATQGLNSIFGLSNATTLVPRIRQQGAFDGLGTSILRNAVGAGLGGLGKGIGGLFNNTGASFGENFAGGFGSTFANGFLR